MEELLGQLRAAAVTDRDVLVHTLLTKLFEIVSGLQASAPEAPTEPSAPPAQ